MRVRTYPKKAIAIIPTVAPSGFYIQVQRDGYVERWNENKKGGPGWAAYASIYTSKTAVLKAASKAIDALMNEGE